jgi:hypothetical protein
MPIRTDVSEDSKGDPSKVIPNQPEPGLPDEGVQPLLPRDRSKGTAPPAGRDAQTPGDRRGLEGKPKNKKSK